MRYDLLLLTNKKLNIVNNVKSISDLKACSWDKLLLIRDGLVNNNNNFIYDTLLQEKKNEYSDIECKIIKDWQENIPQKYFIVKHLKNYSLFLEEKTEPRLYGVVGISEPISTVIDHIAVKLPVLVRALLLPFNKKIIYDGVLEPYDISFSSDLRHSIKMDYIKIKSSYGIITSFTKVPNKKQDDSTRLIELLKTSYSRKEFSNEITELRNKSPKLEELYNQEMGKINAKAIKTQLKKLEITKGWFGILESLIIASGGSKDQVEQIVKQFVPLERQKHVYYFKM